MHILDLFDQGPKKINEDLDQPVEAYGTVYNKRDQKVVWRQYFPNEAAAKDWAWKKNANIEGIHPVKNKQDVAEGLNEFAQGDFNGGDDSNDLQLYLNVAKKLNMKKYKPSTAHNLIAKKMAELVDVVDDDKVDYARHMARKAQGLPNMLEQGVAEGSESLDYQGNCTEDDVVDDIFGDVNNFANMVEKYGDEFTQGNLVVKYDPKKDVHYFYYKKQGVAENFADRRNTHQGQDMNEDKDWVSFEVDSEDAYDAVMQKFGHHIEWQGDYMIAPRHIWSEIEQTAGDAGGNAEEISDENMTEETNPEDTVTVDIPLLIRIMEYAREDAKTDMDLHDVTERLIELSKNGDVLSMKDYESIVNAKSDSADAAASKPVTESIDKEISRLTFLVGHRR